jgi:hypothetical protein
MIPALSPLAGFSPNCWAVFVQIEHCAPANCGRAIIKTKEMLITTRIFFTIVDFWQSYNTIRNDRFIKSVPLGIAASVK